MQEMPETQVQEGNGNPLQYSCLENPLDRGAWWAAVYEVTKSLTQLSDFTFTFHLPALEMEMATHSSVLAWRIPGTGDPARLPSMGSHFVSWLYDLRNNVNSYFLYNKISCTKKRKKTASGTTEFKKERLRAFWIFSTVWKSLQSSRSSSLPPFSWPNLLQYLPSQEEPGLTPVVQVGLEAALLQH